MGNGEWGIGNGEWGIGNREWGIGFCVVICGFKDHGRYNSLADRIRVKVDRWGDDGERSGNSGIL